jgi:hypothetical protein
LGSFNPLILLSAVSAVSSDCRERAREKNISHRVHREYSFAIAVMAHLKTRGTRSDELERKRWKIYLIKYIKCPIFVQTI